MPKYMVNEFYWLQDRKTLDYIIGLCTDAEGKFVTKLSNDDEGLGTDVYKPIGSAVKPLSHYIGEKEQEEWIRKNLSGGNDG